MKTCLVIVSCPLLHDPPNMSFVDGNHEIQALPTSTADQPVHKMSSLGVIDMAFSIFSKLSHIDRNSRSSARTRLPLPKESESLSMPQHQCIRSDDGQDRAPVEESRQLSQRETNRIGGATGLLLSFNIEPELFAQKQILGSQCRG